MCQFRQGEDGGDAKEALQNAHARKGQGRRNGAGEDCPYEELLKVAGSWWEFVTSDKS